MYRKILLAAGVAVLFTSPTFAAERCRDHGKFVKCPPAKPKPPARCRLHGKFVKCGTPGATAA
ncbi:hypothetical protein BH10PSE14_BH10PSE14_27510 [soil metagenome]